MNCFTRLNGIRMTLWCNGLELKKCLYSLNGLGLILWHIGTRLEKYSDYLNGFGLILWCIGPGLTNWTPIDLSRKIWILTWIICWAVSNTIKFSKFNFSRSYCAWCVRRKMLVLFQVKFRYFLYPKRFI